MGKHTYGFPAGTDPRTAITQAIAQARADGYAGARERVSAEVLDTPEHRFTPDERLPVNRPGQPRPAPEICVVIRCSD